MPGLPSFPASSRDQLLTLALYLASRPKASISATDVVEVVVLAAGAHALLRARHMRQRGQEVLVNGGCCIIAGVMGHAWFSINKTLWTGTYVLLTAGTGCLALAVCFAVIGNKKIEIWALPFHVLGMNALAAFVLSELLARTMVQRWWNLPHVDGKAGLDLHTFLYERLFMPLAVPEFGSALWAVVYLLLIVGMLTAVYAVRPRTSS